MICLLLLFPFLLLAMSSALCDPRPVYYVPVHRCQADVPAQGPAAPPPDRTIRK